MKNNDKIIKENFWSVVNQIPQSYAYIEDGKELNNAAYNLETMLIAIDKFSKEYEQGAFSIEDFKELLLQLVSRETNQLILVDESGNVIPDEQICLQNKLAINQCNQEEIKDLAVKFYRTISNSRMVVFHLLNPGKTFMVMGKNMMPSELGVFKPENNGMGDEQPSGGK